MQITFNGQVFDLEQRRYPNGRLALTLVEQGDPESYIAATVNLPDEPLADDEVFIKDYSENEGVLDVLIQAGVVKPTGRIVRTGFVTVPCCKVLAA